MTRISFALGPSLGVSTPSNSTCPPSSLSLKFILMNADAGVVLVAGLFVLLKNVLAVGGLFGNRQATVASGVVLRNNRTLQKLSHGIAWGSTSNAVKFPFVKHRVALIKLNVPPPLFLSLIGGICDPTALNMPTNAFNPVPFVPLPLPMPLSAPFFLGLSHWEMTCPNSQQLTQRPFPPFGPLLLLPLPCTKLIGRCV